MKRVGNLFSQVLTRDNFRLAFYRASLGKRQHREVIAISQNLEMEIAELMEKVECSSFPFGQFRQFVIRDPKLRVISAPRFCERIVHHAVMNVCEPYLDRWLISDSFACRKGLGRNVALSRSSSFAKTYPAYLKLDIRKYFDSIEHATLIRLLAKRFKDESLLALFHDVISSFRGNVRVGLPIGSLTSQHFANFYLGWFDRFVKEEIRTGGYVRYMDDMVIWGESTRALNILKKRCECFLQDTLQLTSKPTSAQLSSNGMSFLGCRVFATHITLNRRSKVRFRTKLRMLEQLAVHGAITERELQSRTDALLAFVRSKGISSWLFRTAVLSGEKNAAGSFRENY